MKKAILFISNQDKEYHHPYPFTVEQRHDLVIGYIVLESIINFKRVLIDYFRSFNVIYVILVAPVTFEIMMTENIRTYTLYHFNIKELFDLLKEINNNAKYHIISASCYGFYMHQYFPLLNKGSSLITLSDYSSITHKVHSLYSIIKRLPVNVYIIDYIMSEYLNAFRYSLNTPIIFFSYYIAENCYKIDTVINYTNAKYYPSIFKHVTDHYSYQYRSPYLICNQINDLIINNDHNSIIQIYTFLYKKYPFKTHIYADITEELKSSSDINLEMIGLFNTLKFFHTKFKLKVPIKRL